eukprot:SAG31_NODE_2722_length_5188_cov_6.223030_5_plen_86_part_00
MHQGCDVPGAQHQLAPFLWELVQRKGVVRELSHGLDARLLVQCDELAIIASNEDATLCKVSKSMSVQVHGDHAVSLRAQQNGLAR